MEDLTSLDGRTEPRTPVALWGLAAAAVALATWLLARVWRRWLAYLVGTPIFLIVLFVFFESFSRLLPAAY